MVFGGLLTSEDAEEMTNEDANVNQTAGDKRPHQSAMGGCHCNKSACQKCRGCPSCSCTCHQKFVWKRQGWKNVTEMRDRWKLLFECKVKGWWAAQGSSTRCYTSENPITSPRPMVGEGTEHGLAAALQAFFRLPGVYGYTVMLRENLLLLTPNGLTAVGSATTSQGSNSGTNSREILTRLDLLQQELYSNSLDGEEIVSPLIMVDWALGVLGSDPSKSGLRHRIGVEEGGTTVELQLCETAVLMKEMLLLFVDFLTELEEILGSGEETALEQRRMFGEYYSVVKASVKCVECGETSSVEYKETILRVQDKEGESDARKCCGLMWEDLKPLLWPSWTSIEKACSKCNCDCKHKVVGCEVADLPRCMVLDISSLTGFGFTERKKAMHLAVPGENDSRKLVAAVCNKGEGGGEDGEEDRKYAVEMIAPAPSNHCHHCRFTEGDYVRYTETGKVVLLEKWEEIQRRKGSSTQEEEESNREARTEESSAGEGVERQDADGLKDDQATQEQTSFDVGGGNKAPSESESGMREEQDLYRAKVLVYWRD